jgi:CMP-N-acetylneuraminic acid synthetase
MDNCVAFIPLRGGSKSIPLKNIAPLAGKPLAFWAIEAALGCQAIEQVYVATDSHEIAHAIARLHHPKLTIISRSPESATDTASSESALIEFCENNTFKNVVFIQATSPLVTTSDLTGALQKYTHDHFDSLLSVVHQKRFYWQHDSSGLASPLNYDPKNRPRRQDFTGNFVENGAFYISSRKAILNSQCRISGNIGLYQMPEETYFELDEPADWMVIETLLKKQNTPNTTHHETNAIDLIAKRGFE